MSLITRKITAFAKKIADLADKPSLGNSTLLKQYWDSSPEELRVAHNGLIDDLTSTTPGSSGSESLGSAPITGVAGATPYAQLSNLKTQLDSAIINPNPAFVSRQAITNGNFSVNQRVVSGTVTLTAGQYGHDRWKAGAAGCTYTFSTTNNVTTLTITAGSLVQIIEGNNLFSGTYTLSWSGTSQGKIDAGSYGAGAITGNAVGGTNLSVEFNVGSLSKVQINAGSTSLPFQPRSFADELALCKRYYQALNSADANTTYMLYGTGMCYSTTQATILLRFDEMRIKPTVILPAAAQFAVFAANALQVGLSSITQSVKSTKSIELLVTVTSGLVAGNATHMISNNNNTSKIEFDAEL